MESSGSGWVGVLHWPRPDDRSRDAIDYSPTLSANARNDPAALPLLRHDLQIGPIRSDVVKNVVLVCAGLVIGATVRGGRLLAEGEHG